MCTRPVAFVAFLFLGSLWVSEWGTAWIWELLVPVLVALGSRWDEREEVGRRRVAGATLAVFSLVVIEPNHVRVSVVIPTHNEAQSIGRVLADLPADIVTEVLVVDSNSSDGTPDIASRTGARVLHEPRRGYGRACLTGLAAASSPDIVVFLDGDYSDRPRSCRFCWLRSSTAGPTSRWVHALGSRASLARCPGTRRLVTVSRLS